MSVTTTSTTAAIATARHAPVRTLLGQAVRVRIVLAASVGALMFLMGLFVGALWPSMRGALADLSAALPQAFTALLAGADMATAIGWTNAEMLSVVAPAGAIVMGAISAGRATAGEEEAKTLGLLLSAPVSRSTVLFAKAAAMVVHVTVVSAMIAAGLVVGSAIGGMDLPGVGILGASLHVWMLGVLFGSVALAVGAAGGTRRLTSAVTGGLAALAFATASFLPLNDALAGFAKASPWYYLTAGDPLTNGAQPGHLLVLVAASIVIGAVAIGAFTRRDLRG